MRQMMIKGKKQFYLTLNDEIPTFVQGSEIIWHLDEAPKFMRKAIKSSENLRALITPVSKSMRSATIMYLYWFTDSIDLLEIDSIVNQNSVSESELEKLFEKSVILTYQITQCIDNCQSKYHTLLIPRVLSYVANPPELISQYLNDPLVILNCPNCGSSFRQPVVNILEEYNKEK